MKMIGDLCGALCWKPKPPLCIIVYYVIMMFRQYSSIDYQGNLALEIY